MQTKAAILHQLNTSVSIETIEIPPCQRGQVLVKLVASGICRSQLNEIKGFNGLDRFLPHLLGHEGSGVVIKTGNAVKKVKVGDHVVLSWIKGSGSEAGPVTYRSGKKIIRAGPIATLSQYAVISENRLTKIPQKIPLDVAALLGCAVATGWGIAFHSLALSATTQLAVFGVGGVGLSVVLGAKMKGCGTIIAVDVKQSALILARKLGATHSVVFGQKKIGDVDFAVEVSGNPAAMEAAIAAVKNTGTVVIAGNVKKGQTIRIDPFDFIKGKRIIGSWGGETDPDRDFPLLVKAYFLGHLPLEKLIAVKFSLNQVNLAFAALEKNVYPGRILIDMSL